MASQDNVLAVTDHVLLSLGEVSNALRIVKKGEIEQINPLIITQTLSQGNYSPLVVFFCMVLYFVLVLFPVESMFLSSKWGALLYIVSVILEGEELPLVLVYWH